MKIHGSGCVRPSFSYNNDEIYYFNRSTIWFPWNAVQRGKAGKMLGSPTPPTHTLLISQFSEHKMSWSDWGLLKNILHVNFWCVSIYYNHYSLAAKTAPCSGNVHPFRLTPVSLDATLAVLVTSLLSTCQESPGSVTSSDLQSRPFLQGTWWLSVEIQALTVFIVTGLALLLGLLLGQGWWISFFPKRERNCVPINMPVSN